MPPHRWKKGDVPNPRGRPRKGTSLAERIRERINLDEVVEISQSIMRGEPMVRVLGADGLPRLATTPVRTPANPELSVAVVVPPGPEAPRPVSMLRPGEVIADVVWPSVSERQAAIKWLMDYGGFKPAAVVEMDVTRSESVDVEIDFSALSAEQLDQYLALSEILAAKNANVLASGDDEDSEDSP